MEIPVPHTFVPGLLSAADMNKYMRDFAEWLMNPPLLIIRKERGRQTLWENDRAAFEFDTVVHDNDAMWDGRFSDRITFKTPGYYLINWQVQWKGVANNTKQHIADYYLSSGTFSRTFTFFANDFENNHFNEVGESHTAYITNFFSAGDYLNFYVTTTGPTGANEPFTIVDYDLTTDSFGHQLEARWLGNPT